MTDIKKIYLHKVAGYIFAFADLHPHMVFLQYFEVDCYKVESWFVNPHHIQVHMRPTAAMKTNHRHEQLKIKIIE